MQRTQFAMELLAYCRITDRKSWLDWALRNHPDKGGDAEKFAMVKNAYEQAHAERDAKPDSEAQTKEDADVATDPFASAAADAHMAEIVRKMREKARAWTDWPVERPTGFRFEHRAAEKGKRCTALVRDGKTHRACRNAAQHSSNLCASHERAELLRKPASE